MSNKLQQGDVFPKLTLNLLTGYSSAIPDDLSSKYTILLFYRGHW